MGANDDREMLDAARDECVRLERQVADLTEQLTTDDRSGFLATVRRDAVIAAATWLEALRDETWNGSVRRPTNYHRAASDLLTHAHRKYPEGCNQ